MFKTLINHWILEQCIDIIFDRIQLNFIELILCPKFKKGTRFKFIKTQQKTLDGLIPKGKYIKKTYHTVKIVDILNGYIIIDFKDLLIETNYDGYFSNKLKKLVKKVKEIYLLKVTYKENTREWIDINEIAEYK